MNFSPAHLSKTASPGHRLPASPGQAMSTIRPYGVALLIVAATTGVAEIIYRLLHTDRLSMIFLVGVLVTAVTQGTYPAYLAAVTAFLVYDFYLADPRFTFRFTSAEDVIILIVFLVAAMLTGRLGGRLRDEARRSRARARSADALFKASRELSSAAEEDEMRRALIGHVASVVGGEAVLSDGLKVWAASSQAGRGDGSRQHASPFQFASGEIGWRRTLLKAKDADLGAVVWRTVDGVHPSIEDERLLGVLLDLGASAIIRARLASAKSEMEAIRRTEQLRTALLSSISHDLRTPLAAILVSSSSLRDYDERFDAEVRRDLVLTIHEEAQRLNRFVENLLNITRLESGALSIGATAVDVADVVREVALMFERRTGVNRVVLDIEADSLLVTGDQILLEQALSNLVDNAIRFAPEGSAVSVRAFQAADAVALEVIDEGPGVPQADLVLIFDKFYRSSATPAHLQGSGLGLSIAKGLVEAMGGSIGARAHEGGRGLAVRIDLPALEIERG